MRTTYRFVPMSEVKLEELSDQKEYHIIFSDGTECLWKGHIVIYNAKNSQAIPPAIISILLPVEPFSPLSEEEINDLGTEFWNKRLEQDVLLRVTISTIYSLGIKKGISLMEGEAEAFAEWKDKNAVPDTHNKNKWMTFGQRNLSYTELLAIFREEQKRKKEKP